MAQSTVQSDLLVMGNLSSLTLTLPVNSVTDPSVVQGANIQATKLQHQRVMTYNTSTSGTAIANNTTCVYSVIASAGATVTAVKMVINVVPTSTDTVVCDVQRSTGLGAYSTILTSPITFNSSSTAKSVVTASLATTSLNQNDLLQVVITGTNSSGKGLLISIYTSENSQ